MPNLSENVNYVKCVILLVLLLLPLPLNGSSLSGGSLDSGQNGQTDSSQQMFRHADGEFHFK